MWQFLTWLPPPPAPGAVAAAAGGTPVPVAGTVESSAAGDSNTRIAAWAVSLPAVPPVATAEAAPRGTAARHLVCCAWRCLLPPRAAGTSSSYHLLVCTLLLCTHTLTWKKNKTIGNCICQQIVCAELL